MNPVNPDNAEFDDDLDSEDPLADDDLDFEDATGTADGGEDFEDFDPSPVLVGLVRGHVARCAYNPKKEKQLIVEVVSEEPDALGAKATAFMDMSEGWQKARLRKLATYLGCKVTPKPNGGYRIHGKVAALQGKAGLFVVETYTNKDGELNSSVAFKTPKASRSPEWEAYAKGQKFNEQQLAAIKDSPGVIDPKKAHLFE